MLRLFILLTPTHAKDCHAISDHYVDNNPSVNRILKYRLPVSLHALIEIRTFVGNALKAYRLHIAKYCNFAHQHMVDINRGKVISL